MTGPALSPVGVVHVTLRVGPPTASQVKLRGIPWETPVEGLAVKFTITGATTIREYSGRGRGFEERGWRKRERTRYVLGIENGR